MNYFRYYKRLGLIAKLATSYLSLRVARRRFRGRCLRGSLMTLPPVLRCTQDWAAPLCVLPHGARGLGYAHEVAVQKCPLEFLSARWAKEG